MNSKKLLAAAMIVLTMPPGLYADQWREVYWSPLYSNVPLSSFPWSALTHITHFNANINSNASLTYVCASGNCTFSQVSVDAQSVISTAHANGAKACMMIGTGQGSNWATATNSANLSTFVGNVMQLMNLGYDCLSLDWEGGAAYNQTQMDAMDQAFKAQMGTKPLVLTVVPNNFNAAQIMANIQSHVDKFDIMTYDFATTSPPSWFNVPLNSDSGATYPTITGNWASVDWNVHNLSTRGIPASKINFGFEANGYVETGASGPRQNVGVSASAINYNRIASTYASQIANPTRDGSAQVPWFQINSSSWMTYDDPTSIAAKVNYAKANGYGIFDWEASGDYVNGGHPLIQAVGTAWGSTTPPPPPPTSCDVNADGKVNVSDVQSCVNQALGVTTCSSCNLTNTTPAACNAVDVQRDVNAALGGTCVTGP